jgi:hypothetical protein
MRLRPGFISEGRWRCSYEEPGAMSEVVVLSVERGAAMAMYSRFESSLKQANLGLK